MELATKEATHIKESLSQPPLSDPLQEVPHGAGVGGIRSSLSKEKMERVSPKESCVSKLPSTKFVHEFSSACLRSFLFLRAVPPGQCRPETRPESNPRLTSKH
jgi:hypothetical protein